MSLTQFLNKILKRQQEQAPLPTLLHFEPKKKLSSSQERLVAKLEELERGCSDLVKQAGRTSTTVKSSVRRARGVSE